MTPGTVQRARCRIGGLIFLLAAAPAGAQEAIIVTGSRTGPDETSTAVVTAEDVERTQPVTALEPLDRVAGVRAFRSEEDTSELQSLMRKPYAVFCLQKKKNRHNQTTQ